MRLTGRLALVVLLAVTSCSSDNASDPRSSGSSTNPGGSVSVDPFNQELHDELVGMFERDQDERTGGPLGEGDEARTSRLKEIIEEFGWPTISLVGDDGEDAAWAIAQHSDQDPGFQHEALDLLREAVSVDDASPGNLAYLTDRVAVAGGEPQTYGTQVRCSRKGPRPITPIEDEAGVDALRAEAGLDPLGDYYDEMRKICSQDAP